MSVRKVLNAKCVFSIILLPAILLASCAKDAKIDPLAGGGGLSGKWVSGDNVFTAELKDGRFVSTANDTGEILTQGSYIVASAESVRLEWRSVARNEDSAADCQRNGPDVLNCADQAGRSFTLRKVGS